MIVTNLADEIKNDVARKNWLDYWRHFSDSDNDCCAETGCCNKQSAGTIVKKETGIDSPVFVIPLCDKHIKNFSRQIKLSRDTRLIPFSYSL